MWPKCLEGNCDVRFVAVAVALLKSPKAVTMGRLSSIAEEQSQIHHISSIAAQLHKVNSDTLYRSCPPQELQIEKAIDERFALAGTYQRTSAGRQDWKDNIH